MTDTADILRHWGDIAEDLFQNDLDYNRLLPRFIDKASEADINAVVVKVYGKLALKLSREEKIKAIAGRITGNWTFRDKLWKYRNDIGPTLTGSRAK
ncbi:MAG: hypothetical protein WAX04_12960 [Oscillospiraceae bacterium]